jgi:C1A family cysteine protease
MKMLKKGIIFAICTMLVFSLVGQKQKKQELTLDDMRQEIARQGYKFTVGKTSVSDVPLENLCGLVIPPDWDQMGKFDGGSKEELALPTSWDWRDQGVVTVVQNQGSCGSCWAFGTIGSYESCVAVAGGGLDDLSEEWLLDCNTLGYDCGGGWWGYPDMYNGVPLESCYPYVGSAGSCNTSCTKYHPMADWYYVGSSSSVPSATDIKNAMYEHGPLSVAVCVDSYFQSYSGGIFSHTSSGQCNHAVILVGWSDSGGYWIMKNSWGTGWGENGYMRIEWGANSIGYSASYGVPENVTPQPPVADFSADPTTIQVGNSVQFTDLTTNSPTSWDWTFEGGTPSSSSSQNPQVTYNTIGTYNVTLTAENAVGSDTETKTDYITVQEVVIDYCDSSGGSQSYEYIAGVEVADLYNASGATAYSDFTYMTANLTDGASAGVSLTPGFTGSSYTEYWRIWIDYNVDGDFDDSGEQVFSGSGSSVVSGSFTVPSGTGGVTTRMRVSMSYSTYPPICGTFTYGEVEDYTADISGGCTEYTLTTNTVGNGSISLNPPGGTYCEGTVVTLTATPDANWEFSGWSGDVSGTQNPTTITMNSNKSVTATFTYIPPPQRTLTVNTVGQGSVTLNPPGGTYDDGTVVTLTAVPGSGWKFDNWSGDLSGTANPTTLTMDANKTVTANFSEIGNCTEIVGYDTVFSLSTTTANRRAMPFTMPENGEICSVTMYHNGGSGNMILGVYDGASLPNNRLGVTASTAVSGSTGWQTIDLTSPAFVAGGARVWLAWVYQSNPGMYYESGSPGRASSSQTWSGGMPDPFGSSTTANYIYSIYANYTPAAPPQYTLTINIVGNGSVNLNPPGGVYDAGTVVTLTATADPGWVFSNWSGDLSGSTNPTTITMNSNKTVTVTFIEEGTTGTVGIETILGSNSVSNYRRAMPFTMPENGTITSVTMYHTGGSGEMILAVYDGEGTPQNLLAKTPNTAVSGSTGWQTINLTGSAFVSGDATVWLAWVYESNPGIRYQTGSPGRYQSSQSWSGGMPDPFGSGSQTSYIYSIYATYNK